MTAKCCSDIAEGEIIQFQNMNNVNISQDQILKISELKTASLFSGSAYCGASLAGATDEEKTRLYNFGKNFGLAFQMMDDILDYQSNISILGKNIHQDLDEGKITLPLYYALNDPSIENKFELFNELKCMDFEKRKIELEKLFNMTGAIEKTKEQIQFFCDKAKQELSGFKNKENLESLIDMLINQNYQ
jgi:octaprenyl-diphosphate synthase